MGSVSFRPQSFYRGEPQAYQLLPFRFLRLDESRRILVNEVGEYALLDEGVFRDFVSKRLPAHREPYFTLKSKHFLMDSNAPTALELLATKYRTKKSFLRGFTKLHIFVVTLRCEHSCQYCQVSRVTVDKTRYDMSLETAEKAIALVFRSSADSVKIEFQGGEPLLNLDTIKWIVDRVQRVNELHRKRVEFVIATNLALVTDEALEFARKHDVFISTSLDGPAFIHNANRPRPGGDSYEVTIRNVGRVREALGHDRVSAVMTTTRLSLKYPREIVEEYVQQGFQTIFLRPVSPYGFAVRTKERIGYSMDDWLEFYRAALEYIIGLNRRGHFLAETYAQILLTKIFTPFATGYVDLQSPAGTGIGVAVYNYDGDVYASDEARMLAEMGDREFRLGNVHKNTYEEIFGGEKLRALVVQSCNESLPGCADCAFQPYCGADPVFHYATQGDVVGHRPTSDFCKKNMAIIRLLIELMEDGDQTTREVLWSWIRNVPLEQVRRQSIGEACSR